MPDPAAPDPASLDAHLGYWLRLVSNAVSESFAAGLAERGVSVAEWVALRLLFDAPSPPSRLAARMALTRGAVTKIADRLAARGLVARTADPADGRGQVLALTEAGRALVPDLARVADANDAAFFAALPEAERAALRRLLADIADRRGLSAPPVG